MREPGRQIPDPNPLACRPFRSHGALPPAAARAELPVAAATGMTESSRMKQERPPIMAYSGLLQTPGLIQEPLRGSRKCLWPRPDRLARSRFDPMAFSAAWRKPARQCRRQAFDLISVACDNPPIRVRPPGLIPERLEGPAQGTKVILPRMDDLRKAGGARGAHRAQSQRCADHQHATAGAANSHRNRIHVPRFSMRTIRRRGPSSAREERRVQRQVNFVKARGGIAESSVAVCANTGVS